MKINERKIAILKRENEALEVVLRNKQLKEQLNAKNKIQAWKKYLNSI